MVKEMTTDELAAALNKAVKSEEFDAEEIERIALEYDRTYSGEIDVWQIMAWCIAKYRNRETNGRVTLPEPIVDQGQQHAARSGDNGTADDDAPDACRSPCRGRQEAQPDPLSGVDHPPSLPKKPSGKSVKRSAGKPRKASADKGGA